MIQFYYYIKKIYLLILNQDNMEVVIHVNIGLWFIWTCVNISWLSMKSNMNVMYPEVGEYSEIP